MKDIIFPKTIKSTRKVEITYGNNWLTGFKFFDIKNTLIYEVGDTTKKKKEILIGADEQIIGIKAKVAEKYPGGFCDFQLMLCKRNK